MNTYTTHKAKGFGLIVTLVIVAFLSIGATAGYKMYTSTDNVTPEENTIVDTSMISKNEIETNIETPTEEENIVSTDDIAKLPEQILPENTTPEIAPQVQAIVDSGEREVIILAGGCFWCSEAFLQETAGVVDVVSGYAGGTAADANYKTVSTGKTAHRESVQVTFDPKRISLEQVLDVFWAHIDPTDAGGQFADRGTQYTTAIYFNTPEQQSIAIESKRRLDNSGLFTEPVVTLILPFTTFFEAEEYHQDYYKKAAAHYERYKKASGRAGFIEDNWAKEAALQFLAGE